VAQHDYVIANGTGAAVRSDLNNALAAIVSQNSGATEPATMYAYQWWADTTTGLLKLRNGANNAWIVLRELDGTLTIEDGTASSPGLAFADDLNTGVFSPGADQVAFTAGGTARLTATTTGITSALPVDVPLGSASAPTVTFTGDTNTGIYSPGADQVAVATNGTGRLFVDASGSISTSSTAWQGEPAYQLGGLQIGASTYAKALLQTGGTSRAEWLFDSADNYLLAKSGSFYIFNTTANPIAFATNNTERARIDSSGRLLVGTSTSPSAGNAQYSKLVVQGNTFATTDYGILNLQRGLPASGGITGNLGGIHFSDNTGNEFGLIQCAADGTTSAGDYPGRLVFSTTPDSGSSPVERMRITNTGRTELVSASDGYVVGTTAAAGTSTELFRGAHSSTAGSQNTGTISIRMYNNGNIQNTNGSYTTLSDAKLKENIVDAGSQWDDFKAIKIRNWNFKVETGHETHRQIGPIAQELEAVCPGLVFETPDRDEDGNETGEVTKGVNQSVLYMKAVKALQEAMERIEQLEQRLTDAGIA
jgi:hypothetical protein